MEVLELITLTREEALLEIKDKICFQSLNYFLSLVTISICPILVPILITFTENVFNPCICIHSVPVKAE
jgi:hypothetical protein